MTTTATPQPAATPAPPATNGLDDIQGNVIGFKNDHQRLLFVTLADAVSGKQFLTTTLPEINTGDEILNFNHRYSLRRRNGRDQLSEQASWVNIGFTFAGLQLLGAEGLDQFPEDFRTGMAARAAIIGDVDQSAPANWRAPFTPNNTVHAVITVAADSPELLEARTAVIRALMAVHTATELGSQDGNTRPADQAGHEHFGFRDGISQPSIAGFTKASKGGDEIAAGEFLLGYPDQDGHISGTATAAQPAPQPGQPGYPGPAPAPAPDLPAWTHNGTFGVYRRLRQDVAGFNDFLTDQAGPTGLTPDQLGAKMVGRWKSGAPLERVPGEPATIDPATTDPSAQYPNALDDQHINDFDYQTSDPDGHAVPLAAHIRKSYPRDSGPGGETESNRHRLLRRGIPYGPELASGETAYSGAAVPDNQDRGLLFVCYQASIERGFEFVQASWSNKVDFPAPGTGEDPIISQDTATPDFTIPPNVHVTTARWVITTGGCYFFVPSISGLQTLTAT